MKCSSTLLWAAMVVGFLMIAGLATAADPLLAQAQGQGVRLLVKQPGAFQVLFRTGAVILGHPIMAVGVVIGCGVILSKVTNPDTRMMFMVPPAAAGIALSYKLWNLPFAERIIPGGWFASDQTVEEFSVFLLVPMLLCGVVCVFITAMISERIRSSGA